MKTVTILSRKGGVGKSTTAGALAYGLAEAGKKTLVIDLDAQRNLTYTIFGNEQPEVTSHEILAKKNQITDAILKVNDKLDAIAASEVLGNADKEFCDIGSQFILKKQIEKLKENNSYDYCIIDTPPSLGILTTNAMIAADTCIIPIQADVFSQQGTVDLSKALEAVREYCNSDLAVAGMLITRYKSRANLTKFMTGELDEYAKIIGTKIYKTKIRECIKISEAQASKESIYEYAPSSNASEDYREFVKEFLKDEKSTSKKNKKGE